MQGPATPGDEDNADRQSGQRPARSHPHRLRRADLPHNPCVGTGGYPLEAAWSWYGRGRRWGDTDDLMARDAEAPCTPTTAEPYGAALVRPRWIAGRRTAGPVPGGPAP